MPTTIEVESTLTDRYQTTVPETVRRALGLAKRDKIRYSIRPGGDVVLIRANVSEGDDPVLGQFLGFLVRDIASHPERLRAVEGDDADFFSFDAHGNVFVGQGNLLCLSVNGKPVDNYTEAGACTNQLASCG